MTVTGTPRETLEKLPYFRSVDGLRAVAVSTVLLFHFAPSVLPAGFLGVDMFFVVSGFLISRIVVSEIGGTGGLGLARFWARRARRLLPALVTVIVVVAIGAGLVFSRFELQQFRAHAIGSFLYVANWVFIAGSGSYFATIGRPSPLLHVWSLSIEEQFYVLFPLVCVAARGVIRRRPVHAAAVALLLAVVSAVWMAVLAVPGGDPSRAYLGSDAHSMGLLTGVALGFLGGSGGLWDRVTAALRQPVGGRRASVVATVVAVAVLLTMRFADGATLALYRGGFLVFSLGVAFVIVVVTVVPGAAPARWLSAGWLVAIGLRSYSLYLWHWPVRVFLTPASGLDGVSLFVARVVCSAVLAEVSYRCIERPFRVGAIARRTGSRGAVVYSVTMFAVTVLLVLTVAAPPSIRVKTASGLSGVPQFEVVGDSTAFALAVYGSRAEGLGIDIGSDARLGCGLINTQHYFGGKLVTPNAECNSWRERWTARQSTRPDATFVVMGGPWEVFDHRSGGRTYRFGTPEWHTFVRDNLSDVLGTLTRAGRPVYLFQAPCYGGDAEPPLYERGEAQRVDAVNAIYEEVAARDPLVRIVRWRDLVCPEGKRLEQLDGVRIWEPDHVHLTEGGATIVWRWFLDQLA